MQLRERQALVLLLAAATAAGCEHRVVHHAPIPTYREVERNDFDFEANHFGWLAPGDRLSIEGRIDDSGFDPFDGFAFRAAGPLYVEFRLHAFDPFADLDLCVYDPQILDVVGCFATASDPEEGAVEILAGGLDFHLVVESFVGASGYRLDVRAFSLYADAPASGSGAPAGPALRAVATAAEAADEAADRGSAERLRAYWERAADGETEPVPVGLLHVFVTEDDHVRWLRIHLTSN